MYVSKIIKVYLFTYICKLLKCISIESRTNQWSEMEHTNYESQVYLLLLFIFIIQTYIPLFLFLLLKLSTNMFNSVFNLYWPTDGGCVGNQTFVSILSGHFICICTGVFVHVGLALAAERQFTTAPVYLSMIILILLYSRCNTDLSALLRTSGAFIDKPTRLSAAPEAPRSTGT